MVKKGDVEVDHDHDHENKNKETDLRNTLKQGESYEMTEVERFEFNI